MCFYKASSKVHGDIQWQPEIVQTVDYSGKLTIQNCVQHFIYILQNLFGLSFLISKRQTHEECDSIHREVESLRTRMVKTEVEVSGHQADAREFNRRLDRLDRVRNECNHPFPIVKSAV